MKAAIYARVSTFDQVPENQLAELRRYVDAREWTATAYVDKGVSGAKDNGRALDQLAADARRRRFYVLVVWRLDCLGRNLRRPTANWQVWTIVCGVGADHDRLARVEMICEALCAAASARGPRPPTGPVSASACASVKVSVSAGCSPARPARVPDRKRRAEPGSS
jgi:hypothetical protein